MLLKATFKRSFWVLFGVTTVVTKKWLTIRMARYIFMRAKNMSSSQYCIIHSPPFGWSDPLYSPPKRCEQHQLKTGCVSQVLDNPPLIASDSTTICTRFISRAAQLCTNLDGNLYTTLTAHSEPLPFSELAETRSSQIIHISIRVLGSSDECLSYPSGGTSLITGHYVCC